MPLEDDDDDVSQQRKDRFHTSSTDNTKCVVCNTHLRKTSGRKKIINSEIEVQRVTALGCDQPVRIGDYLCNTCRLKLYKVKILDPNKRKVAEPTDDALGSPSTSHRQTTDGPDDEPRNSQTSYAPNTSQTSSELNISQCSSRTIDSSAIDPTFVIETAENTAISETVEMPFTRVVSTHNYCFICGFTQKSNLIQVPFDARIQTFGKRRLYIPKGNRCCRNHVIKKRFYDDEVDSMRIHSTKSVVEISELSQFIDRMAISTDKTLLDKIGDFNISEERLKVFTGLSWEDIIQLREMLVSMRNSECRNITQALIVFLFKMRSGNSNKMIAFIFEIEREQQVSDMRKSVLKSFEKDILPRFFGLSNNSREDLIRNHTSQLAKKLYGLDNKLVLICDGTYIRHQKSSNNEYQRKSYSGQKKVPLCKPFTVCTTDGYVVDMLGPFLANKNDADILRTIMTGSNDMQNLMKQGDIFIVDRGFRDVKAYLEEDGYNVLMPALKGKRSQLSTEESNESRFVTKLRWVVEAIHGFIKKKKI